MAARLRLADPEIALYTTNEKLVVQRSDSIWKGDNNAAREVLAGSRAEVAALSYVGYFSCDELKRAPYNRCPHGIPKCYVDLRDRGLIRVPELGTLTCARNIIFLYVLFLVRL